MVARGAHSSSSDYNTSQTYQPREMAERVHEVVGCFAIIGFFPGFHKLKKGEQGRGEMVRRTKDA